MNKIRSWKLKRYLLTYTLKPMPLLCILLLGIVCILFVPISFQENASAWIGGYVLAPVLSIILLKGILKEVLVINRQWAELEQAGQLEEMLADYRKSEKHIGGNLMVGSNYLFGKGGIRVVAYSDIQRIYMENADRRGEQPRDLLYQDRNGQTHFICQLDPMGKSHMELDRIYHIVEKKNPEAETGL